ncbi:conjugative transposon protein TraN [Paraflavisolibacter sp. H34]|uniref:conjugative transposon protein TraN n=1 Tax=Huijunlia imazamoxiresistens TaxID=3127457 RepID=UPI003017A4AD
MTTIHKILTATLALCFLVSSAQTSVRKGGTPTQKRTASPAATAKKSPPAKNLSSTSTSAAAGPVADTAKQMRLAVVYINKDVTTHFISPEPIQYVDISTNKVQGDLPVKTILRLKPVAENIPAETSTVTIVGQKYFMQYKLVYAPADRASTQVTIEPLKITPITLPEYSLSTEDFYRFSINVLKKKPSYHNVAAKAYRMEARLNNIFTVGEYFFIDLSFRNKSRIRYDVDAVRFKIRDKKIVKATNSQDVEIKPVYLLNNPKNFKNQYRNVFVFHKFTFPDNKVLSVELSEKQISGRVITLSIDYSDILNADQL